MADTRKVTGTVRQPSGEPRGGVRVLFTLVPGSYTADDQFDGKVSVTTEADGTFEATLWTNEVGEIASVYLCKLPFGASFRFTLPAGSTPIELSVLRLAGVTTPDPQYDTLVTWELARWKRVWDNATAYSKGDYVTHSGGYYIATADTTAGQDPGVHASWDLLISEAESSVDPWGAAGGYLRSDGAKWARVTGVAWADVTGHPTTVLGYGITDVAPSSHVTDTSNPHAVTKAQVGLSAVENTALSTWAGTVNVTTVAESAVTAHQSALSIAETQIPDGSIFARVAGTETVTGLWSFSHASGLETNTVTERTAAAGVTVDGLLIKDGGIPEAAVTAHQGALALAWSQITSGVPATFAPSAHTHPLADVEGFGAAGGYVRSDGAAWVRVAGVAWADLTGVPATFTPAAHVHSADDITSGTFATARGGTGLASWVLGDLPYASAVDTLAALAGNITTTRKFLRQIGDGAASAAPAWDTVTKADVGLSAVENTALSTWAGTVNITTVAASAVTAHQAAIAIAWSQITSGVPATFAPSAHTHPASEVTAGTFTAGTYSFAGSTINGQPTWGSAQAMDISGNAATATSAGSATTAATATLASTVTVVDSTAAACYVAIFDAATGSLAAKTDAGLTYVATTGILTATGFSGALNGTVGATTPAAGAFTTGAFSGIASFAAGAVTTPSIAAPGDPNTGLWFPALDTVALSTAGVERWRVTVGGLVGIGCTPSYLLDAQQGAGDGIIQAWRSTDVAHGMTAITETDAFGVIQKFQATVGGLSIIGLTDEDDTTGGYAIVLRGITGIAADTAKTTAATAALVMRAAMKSGTSTVDVGANGNLVVIQQGATGTARFIFDAEAEMHCIGATTSVYGPSAVITGTLTTNGGLQTFGANDSGGAGYRLVLVPNA